MHDDCSHPANSARSASTQLLVEIVIVGALCWLFFFYGLASFGLVGADEPRYAQVAREMLERHDWVTPVLYGKPWLEKPAGYYWAAMAGYEIFGVSDWAARLPGAAMASLIAVFCYFWARRFRPGTQLDALVVICSSAFMIGFGRAASTDIQLAAPFAAGMLAWWTWYERGHRGWLALFYVCMAIGTLAKGPVAPLLAGLIITAFAVLRRDWRLICRSLWLPGILVYLAIALPWYIAVQHANPQFFREFILQHNFDRFSTNRYFHKQPFWYYLPVMLAAVLPWTVFVVLSLARGLKNLRHLRSEPIAACLPAFLCVWIVAPLLFFSLSHSKLPGYILPVVVPCGVLVALYLHEARQDGRPPLPAIVLHALLPAILMVVVILAPFQLLRMPRTPQATLFAVIAGAATFVAVAIVVRFRGYRALRTATLVPVALALVYLIRFSGPIADATQSMRPIAAEIQRLSPAGVPVVAFDTPRQVKYGLAFYLNRPADSPQLREFSVTHTKGLPVCGDYVVVARSGSQEALRAILPASASLRSLREAGRFAGPLELYSVRQECASGGS